MTSAPLEPPAPDRGRLYRDLLAVVLILTGVAGINVAAFLASPVAGLAVLSVTTITAGVGLGQSR